MAYLRGLLLLLAMISLAGCFRQTPDTFEQVNSQNASDVSIETPGASDDDGPAVQVIVPERTNEPELPTSEFTPQPTSSESSSPTLLPTADTDDTGLDPDAEPTIIIIDPSDNDENGSSDASNVTRIQPTATRDDIVTPAVMSQIEFPTATPTPEGSSSGIQPAGVLSTPTDLADGPQDCMYTIESGDTLFGLALSYGVSLEELLIINNLTEDAVIQPGDTVEIPDCGENASEDTASDDEPTPDISPTPSATPTTEVTEDGIIHIVSSGETLYNIALNYGTTVNAIINANELVNPNALSIGQRLLIPVLPEETPEPNPPTATRTPSNSE